MMCRGRGHVTSSHGLIPRLLDLSLIPGPSTPPRASDRHSGMLSHSALQTQADTSKVITTRCVKCVCVCVCVRARTCVCVGVCVYARVHAHTYTCTRVHTSVCTRVRAHAYLVVLVCGCSH